MKITLTKPTRLWPYLVLGLVINFDGLLPLMVPKEWPYAGLVVSIALSVMKAMLWPLVFDFGFRTAMDAWRAKHRREEDRRHARFVRLMDESNEQHKEFVAWWNSQHNAGEGWKNGGET